VIFNISTRIIQVEASHTDVQDVHRNNPGEC
jgi:hypothetical protein